jgi:hypothetical protein
MSKQVRGNAFPDAKKKAAGATSSSWWENLFRYVDEKDLPNLRLYAYHGNDKYYSPPPALPRSNRSPSDRVNGRLISLTRSLVRAHRSIIANYVGQPFWRWVVEFLPHTMACVPPPPIYLFNLFVDFKFKLSKITK